MTASLDSISPFSEVLTPSCNGPVAAPRIESQERIVLVGAAVDGGVRTGPKLWLGHQTSPHQQPLRKLSYALIMLPEEPDLYATLAKGSTGEIVYVLIIPGENQRTVAQISGGAETPLKAGTEFETREAADAAVRTLIHKGFAKQEPGCTFDALQSTLAVALRLGYTHILDSRHDIHSRPPINFLGKTTLKDWTGVTTTVDGSWEYALDYGKISARPKQRVELPSKRMSGAEFVAAMKPALEKRKALGGEQSFPLSRN
jgi:hypothetical protein